MGTRERISHQKKRGSIFTLLLAAAAMTLMVGILWMVISCIGMVEEDRSNAELDLLLEQRLAEAEAQRLAREASENMDVICEPLLEGIEGVKIDLLPVNEYSRPAIPMDEVHSVVIHYVANPGATAQQNRDYFASLAQSGEESVSSHFVIGLEGEIIQCIPLDEKSYCTNHRNFDTISIECCHPDSDGSFNDDTRDSLVSLVRYLVKAYGLEREDGVIRHYDVTGKLCPLYYVEHPKEWEKLLDDIFS